MDLEVHRIGTNQWPRYFLLQRKQNNALFWTGQDWSPGFQKVRLYAFLEEACREFERLQVSRHPSGVVQEFEAKVTVKLHADRPISERELSRFLDRFAELFLPTDGPTDDSLIQAEIHWHELRSRASKESCDRSSEESSE